MKPKIAVLLLAVLLCLTTGCNNASHIAETPAPISSSDSNIVPSESETAQAEKKTEVDRPQSTELQTSNRVADFPASVSESDTQTTEVPDQAEHSTAVLSPPSEPEKKTRRVRTPTGNRMPAQKKNSPHLRQLRNRRHRNRRKKNLLSRSLTLTTGSALPRATPRASDLRSTAEPCIAGITPSPQV